jgi:hypothetical protein
VNLGFLKVKNYAKTEATAWSLYCSSSTSLQGKPPIYTMKEPINVLYSGWNSFDNSFIVIVHYLCLLVSKEIGHNTLICVMAQLSDLIKLYK